MFLLNFNATPSPSREEVVEFLLSHREKLKEVAQAFYLEINGDYPHCFRFMVSPEEIIEVPQPVEELPLISLDFETLKKVLEKPSRAIRFYFQGKIKIKGNVRDLFKSSISL
ncbi:MAG: SCP2 sterol-binding domain-containing protein [Caldimicrobium sp.]|nr:SCP2 sterol-binding domain-containing protein [Caldimicrobium sp.]MCX7613068.1 SCP2 sterol-binding domain-containing protein [Caldimicrobium sp.]MDW8182781.1 hypothetical protein [Caldimicrobium sp.]